MKRNVSLILALVMVLSLFTGCGVKKAGKEESQKTVITVGGWPTAEGPTLDSMNEKLKAFNKKYAGKIEVVPDTWAFSLDTFLVKAASGQLPTVYTTHFTETDRIISAGYAADITKQMKNFGYADKLNDNVKNFISRDGKYYMVPNSAYTMGMLANMEVLREAGLVDKDDNPIFPKTYDELTEYSKIVKEKTGKTGFVMPTTNNIGGWHFVIIAWANGVNFMKKVDGKWKATFNTPECVKTLQWIKDLKWKYNVLNANTLIDYNEGMKLIGTGQAAYYLQSAPQNALFSTYGMDKNDVAMGVIPEGDKKHVTLMGGSAVAISNKATEAQKDAAFKWFEFTGLTPNATADSKTAIENEYATYNAENYAVGVPKFSQWSDDAEITKFREEVIKKYTNIPIGHVNQYKMVDGLKVQTEEPVCCQDLYGALDACIQEVLTNKNADCKKIIADAAKDFQANYLDNAK